MLAVNKHSHFLAVAYVQQGHVDKEIMNKTYLSLKAGAEINVWTSDILFLQSLRFGISAPSYVNEMMMILCLRR